MGYGWNTRSPEDVQRHNGGAYTFDKIAKRYEEVVPIRGKRKAQNIRPHGERARCWERIVKVNDNEYYLTNNAYAYYEKHGYTTCRAITFKRDDEGNETIIVHTPRKYWGEKPEDREALIPKQLGVPSSFFFYAYNLPQELNMAKYHSKNYLTVSGDEGAPKFYTLDKGDVHLVRQVGEKYFKPLIVHRETKHYLDRAKTKAIRDELKEFKEYVRVMLPLAEADRQSMYSSPVHYAHVNHEYVYNKTELISSFEGKGWRYLFAGEPKEVWFNMVQYYKYQCDKRVWNYVTREYDAVSATPQKVMAYITNEVFRHEKPLREELVELGVRTFDKYRNW
jgi:hypothetical protein